MVFRYKKDFRWEWEKNIDQRGHFSSFLLCACSQIRVLKVFNGKERTDVGIETRPLVYRIQKQQIILPQSELFFLLLSCKDSFPVPLKQ